MGRYTRWFTGLVVLVMLGTLLAACGGTAPTTPAASAPTAAPAAAPAASGNVKELTILWAQWDPSNYLQQLVKDYKDVAGVDVKVLQEPWGTFGDRFFTEMAGKGTSYDMVVGDSQWLGQGATQGHYLDLTDVFNSDLNGKALAPATVTAYAEYPKGGGKFWAYPLEGDADGWAYRKDLFEDPAEQAAFKTKYGYDLKIPETWMQLRDIAEFFTRPDKNLYGLSIYTQKDYDAITMGFENVMFSWGADWGDFSTYKVDGVLNSKEGVDALDFYKSLYKFVPPGSSNDFFQEVNNKFTAGQVAMGMNYFAFLPALANKASNPFADKTGYFSNPKGPSGKSFAALGGQGISIINYISDERKQASMAFLKWLAKDDTQKKWAQLGGYTCNNAVLNSDEFKNATPYNAAFADTMQKVKDFWAVPVYSEMLQVSQTNLHNFVVADQGTAKEALDDMAKKHEETLKKAGLLK
ncbi:MAG: extracellular solute-binding protein [Kouleothrix sp.]|nr:extracellular solute-binding protein [Kouleothrix sp.]